MAFTNSAGFSGCSAGQLQTDSSRAELNVAHMR